MSLRFSESDQLSGPPFLLQQSTIVNAGVILSTIWFISSVFSIPASTADFTISDINPGGLAVSPLLILLID